MKTSLILQAINGILILVALILVLTSMNNEIYTNTDIVHLLLLFSIAIGVHGLMQMISEPKDGMKSVSMNSAELKALEEEYRDNVKAVGTNTMTEMTYNIPVRGN